MKTRILATLAMLLSVATLWAGVPLDEEHFPDAAFRSYLQRTLQIGSGHFLTDQEIAEVKTIQVSDSTQYSLEGIEYLTAINRLECNGCALTDLDLSKNTALNYLDCTGNFISRLVLSKTKAPVVISCANNCIVGEAMDSLVARLPSVTADVQYSLYLLDNQSGVERNTLTDNQASIAMLKGWHIFSWKNDQWVERPRNIIIVDDNIVISSQQGSISIGGQGNVCIGGHGDVIQSKP